MLFLQQEHIRDQNLYPSILVQPKFIKSQFIPYSILNTVQYM